MGAVSTVGLDPSAMRLLLGEASDSNGSLRHSGALDRARGIIPYTRMSHQDERKKDPTTAPRLCHLQRQEAHRTAAITRAAWEMQRHHELAHEIADTGNTDALTVCKRS